MSDKSEIIHRLQAIEAKRLSPANHMMAELAVALLEYRNALAEERAVSREMISVDDLVDWLLRTIGIAGVNDLD